LFVLSVLAQRARFCFCFWAKSPTVNQCEIPGVKRAFYFLPGKQSAQNSPGWG